MGSMIAISAISIMIHPDLYEIKRLLTSNFDSSSEQKLTLQRAGPFVRGGFNFRVVSCNVVF